MTADARQRTHDLQADFAYAVAKPALRATIKQRCEDFCVEEELAFEPEGSGEHVFLQVRKRNQHTQDIVYRLAKLAMVRHGVTDLRHLIDPDVRTLGQYR